MLEDNFRIYKNESTPDTTEIDIFSDIGESWWGESTSFQEVKAQVEAIDSEKIKINLATYGGDVNHAFAISNILKTSPATVEANIMGFTASAGTIIALAADTVKMDENTMFLVHNAWTVEMGNQHDMRATADELEKIDNRLISIYKSKTGERKDKIHNLMKEERWMDADEAKSWGFVDEVYEPKKAAASYTKDIEKINNFRHLPEIKKKENNSSTMNFKEELSKSTTEIKNYIDNLFSSNKDTDDKPSKEEIEAQVNKLVEEKALELETKYGNELSENVVEKDKEIKGLNEKVAEMEKENAELKGEKTQGGDGKQDPPPAPNGSGGKDKSIRANILNDIISDMTPSELAQGQKTK